MFCFIQLPVFLIHLIILLYHFYFSISISEDDEDTDEPWQDDGQNPFWIGCKSKSTGNIFQVKVKVKYWNFYFQKYIANLQKPDQIFKKF